MAKPALILFHGWGYTHRCWEPAMSRLMEHFTVYEVPGPGYLGELPYATNEDAMCDYIAEHVPPGILCGWSLGGHTALRVAKALPEHALGVLTVGSTPCFIAQTDWPGIPMKDLAALKARLVDRSEASLRRFYSHAGYMERVAPVSPAVMDSLLWGLECLEKWDDRSTQWPVHWHAMLGGKDPLVPVSIGSLLTADQLSVHSEGMHNLIETHTGSIIEILCMQMSGGNDES